MQWAVFGAGSWGTVLAVHLARAGHRVLLWSHDPEHCREMADSGANERFVPGVSFPSNLTPTSDAPAAADRAEQILVVVPSHAFRATVQRIAGHVTPRHRLAWGTKGLEPGSRKLLHEVAREELGSRVPLAVISGPTFAREVVQRLPCAITVASDDGEFALDLAVALRTDNMLAYTSGDMVGVQIGGATKNVIAVAVGASDALRFGANARAALITRGLDEITRLGEALGGRRETFMGLSGLGDLVLTCSDDQSRNRRFGLAMGGGMDVEAAQASIGQVVEARHTAESVVLLARSHGLRMPICEQVHQVINGRRGVHAAVAALLRQVPGPEAED